MITCNHGTKIPSSQGAKDHGNQKTSVVDSHGAKVALSPGARTPSYVNLFDQKTQPL
jgi:hypothetical protein